MNWTNCFVHQIESIVNTDLKQMPNHYIVAQSQPWCLNFSCKQFTKLLSALSHIDHTCQKKLYLKQHF